MAKYEITMPQMGESITTGTITGWRKKAGDAIEQEETLLDISTDKVESEIPSPYAGVVTKLLFAEGDVVEVGKAIAIIDDDMNATAEQSPSDDKKVEPIEFDYDVAVIGGGPGGYVAAIRASQLGKKVVLFEKDKLGGVCLNRGCIPTKALLKSAHAVAEIKDMKSLGVNVELVSLDGEKAVKRAAQVSSRISKGVPFLMKKNNIEVISGEARLDSKNSVVYNDTKYKVHNIIIATGAHYKSFPGLEHDGDKLIGAWEALEMTDLPGSIGIVGAGAIGMEFAYFWNAFGVKVHIFELQSHLLPIEDDEVSVEIEKAYKKLKINYSLGIDKVTASVKGDKAVLTVTNKGEASELEFDKVLIAVGMTGNLEGYGLETLGIETERGAIKVSDTYETSVAGVYAIGDVAGAPMLAHAASHEGVIAAEHLSGKNPHPLDKMNIAGCTYCYPQVASVGYRERELKEEGISYKVGKVPFMANGKAIASNEKSGFIKVLMGDNGEMLGAHIVGEQATELIFEYVLFRAMEGIDEEIYHTVHPHPTLGEFLSEAVMAAAGRSINI